jgi:outer membrane protein assembly factor BamC
MPHMNHRLARLTALAIAPALVAGCGLFSSNTKSMEYRTAKASSAPALEVPPELTNPTIDERFVVPNQKGQTFSTYSRDRNAAPVSGTAVLPKVAVAKLERSGDQRWLVVSIDPDKLWPVVREFWVENGFVIKRDSPDTGIMETDWAENRAKIPQDTVSIRGLLERALPDMYSTSQRDKFRTRMEKSGTPNLTEVYITHRGVEEVFSSPDKSSTIWQPRQIDIELEAEFLNRLLVKLGVEEQRLAAAPAGAAAAQKNAVLENNGAGPLVVNDGFDRAWRRVGLALDRAGFTVEDRDRTKGVFFVRYADPNADTNVEKKGFLDKLAFWKSDPKLEKTPQFRIRVSDAGASLSQVEVQSATGTADTTETGKRILSLLFDQLK